MQVIADIPLITGFCERIGLQDILNRHISIHGHQKGLSKHLPTYQEITSHPQILQCKKVLNDTIKKIIIIVGIVLIFAFLPVLMLVGAARTILDFSKKSISYLRGKKDAMLILETTDDPNGAFKSMPMEFPLSPSPSMRYFIVKKPISEIADIAREIHTLEEQSCKIKVLWMRCHGSPQCIFLGKGNKIDFENVDQLREPFKKLDLEASIMLEACETGLKKEGQTSIAEKIADCAPKHFVYSSLDRLSHFDLAIYSYSPLRIQYYTVFKGEIGFWKYVIGDILARCFPFIVKQNMFVNDKTAVYFSESTERSCIDEQARRLFAAALLAHLQSTSLRKDLEDALKGYSRPMSE